MRRASLTQIHFLKTYSGGIRKKKNLALHTEDWLQSATHTQVKLWPGWGYGYQWWTMSDGTFRALGIYGQMIHLDPARHLVVVLNCAWPEAESFKRQKVVDNFLRSVNSEIDKENKELKNSPDC
jgi:CubicO group peptidase (beta-lactamase class C family)